MNKLGQKVALAAAVGLALADAAYADGVKFMDPTGDDKGPGNYVYPTDAVYTAGSFDLVEFEVLPVITSAEAAAAIAPRL